MDGFPVETIGREPEEFDEYKNFDQGFLAAITLYDLDGDGTLELIGSSMDARLYVFSSDGSNWGPYPIEICTPDFCGEVNSRSITSPAVGDINNNNIG